MHRTCPAVRERSLRVVGETELRLNERPGYPSRDSDVDDVEETVRMLRGAQAGLRSRFDDFHRALDRRDGPAYRLALADFHERLGRWTAAEESALFPAFGRAPVEGRDARRELRLEFVQMRELTRQVRLQLDSGAPMSDVLGLVENLARRFGAHERGVLDVYYPAAAEALEASERAELEIAAREL